MEFIFAIELCSDPKIQFRITISFIICIIFNSKHYIVESLHLIYKSNIIIITRRFWNYVSNQWVYIDDDCNDMLSLQEWWKVWCRRFILYIAITYIFGPFGDCNFFLLALSLDIFIWRVSQFVLLWNESEVHLP